MTKILLALATLAGAVSAAPIDEDYANRLARAIFYAEGGRAAKVSHGILSVKTRDPRRVCLNTIKNSWTRFEAAGMRGDFIEHLGSTYCPIKGDRTGLNKNWVKNVRARLPARRRDFSVS